MISFNEFILICSRICQFTAIFVMFIGVFKSLIIYFRKAFLALSCFRPYTECRVELSNSIGLGLTFLICASVIRTTTNPTWNEIAQLIVIILIRTALNQLLILYVNRQERRMKEENCVDP